MPSNNTITSSDFTVFTPATKARSAEVNANFSVFRGHLLPLSVNTSSAATSGTYDLGASDHFWRNLYVGSTVYQGVTSTTNLTIQKQTTTTGAYELLIGSTTVGMYDITGYAGPYKNASIPLAALADGVVAQTFSASGTFTVPTSCQWVIAEIIGGGGGGGGGAGGSAQSGGGAGGGSSGHSALVMVPVAGLTVLSITVGAGGAGGSGGGGGSNGSTGATGSSSIVHGAITYTALGGNPGGPGLYNGGGGGAGGSGGSLSESWPAKAFDGGGGGTAPNQSGVVGTSNMLFPGGSAGAGGGGGAGSGGGGGGASLRGTGGNGGNGGGGGAGGAVGGVGARGSGGGGGGGASLNGSGAAGGTGGNGGTGQVTIFYI